MDKTNKLLFFNKEGYPYNFQYDEDEQKWNGKLIFDENSSELFKTIGLYTFEKVDAFNFSALFNFEESQLFNWSGITFKSQTYEDQLISNIEKVNSNSNFYTKWIYGENFDTKFRKGTVVSFTGDTSSISGLYWSDFNEHFFNVMGTKKDAILISTETDNSTFNDFIFSTGITLTSHNIIKVPTYGNSDLVNYSDLDYYDDKKLTIVNSTTNDGIYTYKNEELLNNKIYDFNLSNETTGTLNLEITLFTERPKIYSGPVDITITDNTLTGSTILFTNKLNKNIDFTNTGQTIIFEKYNGDNILTPNPIFTITGYKSEIELFTGSTSFIIEDDRYFIYLDTDELPDLKYLDKIRTDSYPFISGETFHHGREFTVLSISLTDDDETKIEVEQYVIYPDIQRDLNSNYKLIKLINNSQIDTVYAQQSSYIISTGFTSDSNCYSTSNTIYISQDILLSGDTTYYYENTINSLKERYDDYLENYGIILYHHYYSGNCYMIIEGIFDYITTHSYFDISSDINNISLSTDDNFIYSTGFTNSYYIEVDESLNNESIYLYDEDKLNNLFTSEILLDLNNDLMDYGFKIMLNENEYFINFSNTSGSTTYTNNTIINFINKYEDIFNKLGFNLYSGYTDGYTLNIDGKYPNISVTDLDVFVNSYSSYSITNTYNNGIVISSNQLKSLYTDLYNLELSTGMIISVNDSIYPLNNKDYNIIRIDNNIIQLSYQGPFFDESNVLSNIYINEYIRKPRSYYNKDIYYKFSWVEQTQGEIDDSIFFYDISGSQLKPYNNMTGLTYEGITPLYDSSNNVYLNKDKNKFNDQTTNPSAQQTVYSDITFKLENLNESDSYNYVPAPLELFIGFNSPNEGVSYNEMKLEKIENISYTGVTQNTGTTEFKKHFVLSGETIEYITNDYLFDFTSFGFETDQLISIDFIDSISTGQTIYTDYDYYRIKNITPNKIFIDTEYSNNLPYFNTIEMIDNSGKTFEFKIKTEPKEILNCKIYGQTEIEDERLDINLKNLGIKIYKDDEFIFKESDINENSIDYIRLNRKRKEMLSIYTEIFNYVGSYKALIHAIDFFGYNDLKLNEYYRNIKPGSPLYGKLHKILIPDIFDNTIEGWNPIDYIKDKYDKGYYKKTNLFNLTYRITDIYGNYSYQYSLEEVQIKLMALVKWLRKNIIPLSSNIMDITGVADTTHTIMLRHDSSNWVSKSIVDDSVSAINFNYTATRININNYTFNINFYVLSGCTSPDYFTVRIKTFSLDPDTNELLPQQNLIIYKTDYNSYTFTLNIDIDPYISIETSSYNGYGVGYSNSKMFKYNEGKNFFLINKNFNVSLFPYLDSDEGYFIIEDGRYWIVKH